jgi:hypothetical protein
MGTAASRAASGAGDACTKVIGMFQDCWNGRRPTFGNRRRALVNLQDMGIDIYQPAGALEPSYQ